MRATAATVAKIFFIFFPLNESCCRLDSKLFP
jgi:hypothetical protein